MQLNIKILITIILLIILVFVGAFFFLNSNQIKQEESDQLPQTTTESIRSESVDYKASFAIYTNGTFRVFTAPMYHNLSADVFIEASNPNIVNIKRSNVTWSEFFETLPFSLSENCLTTGTKQTFCTNEQYSLQFYLNGTLNQRALDQIINPGDKLLVTYDRESSNNINQQLQSIPNPE